MLHIIFIPDFLQEVELCSTYIYYLKRMSIHFVSIIDAQFGEFLLVIYSIFDLHF